MYIYIKYVTWHVKVLLQATDDEFMRIDDAASTFDKCRLCLITLLKIIWTVNALEITSVGSLLPTVLS